MSNNAISPSDVLGGCPAENACRTFTLKQSVLFVFLVVSIAALAVFDTYCSVP